MRVASVLLFALALTNVGHAQPAVAGMKPEARIQAAPEPQPPVRDLAPMVVSEVRPGPGLWQVIGGDGHVMWVLGTVQPLPADLEWQSAQVEAVIARSDQLLWKPGFAVNWDVGFFKGLTLLPSALRIRRNPDGAELEDVLPADLYARWRVQKNKYIGWKWGIEHWRPVFAADELYGAALKEHGLDDGIVDPVIKAAAAASGMKPTPVTLHTDVDEPRALIKDFNRSAMDDVACMERVLARLEHELPILIERANAWATGDIATLRRLPARDVEGSCLRTVMESDVARRHGYRDLERRVEALWLGAAEQALTDNAVTFAVLPMGEVLAADGLLARLVARGYRLLPPPGAQEPTAASPASVPPVTADSAAAATGAGPIDVSEAPIDGRF